MVKRVTPIEAGALLKEGWTYLDVRSIPEFDSGHPAGAVNIPLLHKTAGRMTPNPAFQAVIEGTFPKDAKIVVGCKAGPRSAQAAMVLESAGYTNVVDMRGGFFGECDNFGRVTLPGWAESGLPVETAAPAEKTYAELEKAAGRK
jgi:rhodanese-related sulfurtransferase